MGEGLPGQVDNFELWGRPLTDAEMARGRYAIKNRNAQGTAGLVRDFIWDECNDGTSLDLVGTVTLSFFAFLSFFFYFLMICSMG